MKRLLVLTFFCILATLSVVPARASSHTTAAANRLPPRTDAQIDALIRTKLAKSKIGKDGFRFRVQRGVVTWDGSTDVVQHKGSATRMAKTAGATQVINNIQVSAGAKSRAAAQLKRASIVR